jgi:hypothetical protein
MSEPKKPQKPGWPIQAPPATPADNSDAAAKRAGKVVHDARGNAVWDWSRSPTDSTTHLLRKLDSPELSLADDAAPKDPPTEPATGVDRYANRSARKSTTPAPPAPAAKTKAEANGKPKGPPDSVLKQLLGKR